MPPVLSIPRRDSNTAPQTSSLRIYTKSIMYLTNFGLIGVLTCAAKPLSPLQSLMNAHPAHHPVMRSKYSAGVYGVLGYVIAGLYRCRLHGTSAP